MTRIVRLAALALLVLLPGLGARLASEQPLEVHAGTAPTISFRERIAAYAQLRREVAEELLANATDGEGQADADFSRTLGAALQAARGDARPGDIFSTEVADRLLEIVRGDLSARPWIEVAAIRSEIPTVPRVRVNDFYPNEAPLATMPPLMLFRLDPLPPELQYRFLDDALILLDVDTGLVVDFVPNVFGRTS